MALMILTACVVGISPGASGAGQNGAQVKKDLVLTARGFNVKVAILEQGTPFLLSDVRGMVGVGHTEEEAQANLSTVKIGKDPAGRDILYVDQKRPVRGLTRLYLDVINGIPVAHSAMPSLFEIKELENRLAAGDRSVLPNLRSFLKNELPLVRQAATSALAKAGPK
jgi:hypothetical protein